MHTLNVELVETESVIQVETILRLLRIKNFLNFKQISTSNLNIDISHNALNLTILKLTLNTYVKLNYTSKIETYIWSSIIKNHFNASKYDLTYHKIMNLRTINKDCIISWDRNYPLSIKSYSIAL